MPEKVFADLRDLIIEARKHIEASRRRAITAMGQGKVSLKHTIESCKHLEIGFFCNACEQRWVMDMHAWGRWLREGTPSQRQLIVILFATAKGREGIAEILNQPDFLQSYYLVPFEQQAGSRSTERTIWERLDDDDLV